MVEDTVSTKKICFAASSGGHFEQLMMLKPLMDQYASFILTERTNYRLSTKGIPVYRVMQINRQEKSFPIRFLLNWIISAVIFMKERPDIMITTGVLAVIPMALLCKLFHKKLIFIESYAKVTSATETGKLMYRIADRFYVQWESMKAVYPNAIYLGSIF